MKMVQNFGCGWIFSIFCWNSRVIKVLVQEMSEKNLINKKIHEFRGLMKGGINKTLSGWKWCKILGVGEFFQLFVEFPEFGRC